MVMARRAKIGIWRWMKPCMTTWPDIVPTQEEAIPEASRATPEDQPAVRAQEPVQAGVDLAQVVARAEQPAGVEHRGGHGQHGQVDQPGDAHRDA